MNEELIPVEVRVAHPSAAYLSRGSASALELVEAFEVVDDATYGLAAEELVAIKGRASKLEEQRKAITKPMDDAKKSVMDLFRGPIEMLTKAEGMLKAKMLAYSTEQRRKSDEARLAAERAAAEERARLEREAAELVAAGRAGEAAVKSTVASMVVAAPAVVEPAKVSGVATRETVEFEVDDLLALVRHVAQRPELIGLLAADSLKLRAYVRGLGTQANLPGVRVFVKQSLSARRA
jgi:hypothetical protein